MKRTFLLIRLMVAVMVVVSGVMVGRCQNVVCVRVGASGNGSGSDWVNAMTSIPGTLVRGDSYYVAAGTYSAPTLNSLSGTSMITIKKATVADHGIATRWSDSYAAGPALFQGNFEIRLSYVTIDGVTGGGPGSWTNGFGFVMQTGSGSGATPVISTAGGLSNITVKHCEVFGNNNSTGGGSAANDGFSLACWGNEPNSFSPVSNMKISYCYTHDIGRCPFIFCAQYTVVEYCCTGSYTGNSGQHSEILSWSSNGNHDATFRYCLFTHVASGSTGGLGFDNQGFSQGNFAVYGCVFDLDSSSSLVSANGVIFTWGGGGGEVVNGCSIYNNTFINVPIGQQGSLVNFNNKNGTTGIVFTNNLIYTSDTRLWSVNGSDYNHWVSVSGGNQGETHSTTATGNPFNNYQAFDFSLKTNTQPGVNLGSPYNVAADGVTRTTWTRGAYEYVRSGLQRPPVVNGVTITSGP